MSKDKFRASGIIYLFLTAWFCAFGVKPALAATRTEAYQELMSIPEPGAPQPAPAEQAPVLMPPVADYQAENFRDPFQKYAIESKTRLKDDQPVKNLEQSDMDFINSLIVQGIILGGRFPQAIIDNNVVKVGDTLQDARIVAIGKEGVSLLLHNRIYTVTTQGGNQ